MFKTSDQLGPGEGALIMMNHSAVDRVVFNFTQQVGMGSIIESGVFTAGVQFRMLRLPAGEYNVSSITASGIQFNLGGPSFTIKPGVISYIGDSFVDLRYDAQGRPMAGWVRTYFADRQDRLEVYLSERFPDIGKRYPLEMVAKEQEE